MGERSKVWNSVVDRVNAARQWLVDTSEDYSGQSIAPLCGGIIKALAQAISEELRYTLSEQECSSAARAARILNSFLISEDVCKNGNTKTAQKLLDNAIDLQRKYPCNWVDCEICYEATMAVVRSFEELLDFE